MLLYCAFVGQIIQPNLRTAGSFARGIGIIFGSIFIVNNFKMKIRCEILIATFLGIMAICMDCNPSQKAAEPKISIDTVSSVNAPLFGTHWKLIELMGRKIADSASKKEMYLVLKKDSTVEGNGGCNAFSASFIMKGNEITFSPLVSTKVYCPGLPVENEFFKALSTTDRFSLNSDTLSFREGKILTTAKFKAK